MANQWNELFSHEEDFLGGALHLLQLTLRGYTHLSLDDLVRKMNKASGTSLLNLHVYAFATDFYDPVISAFFFLRRNHRTNEGDKQPWAYCLTVGAQLETSANQLTAIALKAQLVTVCARMRREHAGPALLEVMHRGSGPAFKTQNSNLEQAYGEFTQASTRPRLASKSTPIVVEYPWTPLPRPQSESLTWFNIVE